MSHWHPDYADAKRDADEVEDTDQHAVYGAEARVVQKPNHVFSEFDSCVALVDAITQSPYWYERGGDFALVQPIACYRQRDNARSRGGHWDAGWAVRLNRRNWNVLAICHELAHVMTFWRHTLPKGHAREFRTEYLSLVRYVAPDLAGELSRVFVEAGLEVDHDPTGWGVEPFDFPVVERVNGAIAL